MFKKGITSIFIFILFASVKTLAQSPEDQLGSWLMYVAQYRLTDKWSIHSDLQLRSFDLFTDPSTIVLRPGLNFHPNTATKITAGYAFIFHYPFDEENSNGRFNEHRLWQMAMLKNRSGRFYFNHIYRMEQRWKMKQETDFQYRIRYMLQVRVPLNKPVMEIGTWFLMVNEEIFMQWNKEQLFDQNRVFAGLGYQLNKQVSLKAGYLNIYTKGTGFHNVFVNVGLKPDFRKKKRG